MTIPADNYQPTKTLGNGATVDFSFDWNMIDEENSRVFLEDVATGVQVLQTLDSDYTLVFDDDGGTVTFITAPTSDSFVIVSRDIAKTQETAYSTSSGFQGVVTENSFDKVTAITQDLTELADRTLAFKLGSSFSTDVPDPEDGLVLGWDGETLVNKTGATGETLPATPNTYIKRNAGNTAYVADIQPTTNATNIATNVTNIATNTANIHYADGYIKGVLISNDGSTPDEIIQISSGKARSSDDTIDFTMGAGNRDITNSGHWKSGVVPTLTNASIFVWIDENGGSTQFILDDATGSNISGEKRRVGAFITDGSGDIILFTKYEQAGGGIETLYDSSILDHNSTSTSTTINLSVVTGIEIKPNITLTRELTNYSGTSDGTLNGITVSRVVSVASRGPNSTANVNFIPTATASFSYAQGDALNTRLYTNGFIDERVS